MRHNTCHTAKKNLIFAFMKNICRIIMVAVLAVSAASCTKEYITEEYYNGVTSEILSLKIDPNEWTQSNDGMFFSATFKVPSITQQACDEAIINVYRVYPDGVQAPLPSVRLMGGTDDIGNFVNWTESIDYEFTAGSLTIFYTVSDFYYDPNMFYDGSMDMKFRLVITY